MFDIATWIERVADYLARDGMPAVAGRSIGWLMICDPPEQTPAQIASAVGASRASLTSTLRLLEGMGFVSRRTKPGAKTGYYRMADRAWETVVRRQIQGLAGFREITQEGVTLLGDDPVRTTRLTEAQRTLDRLADLLSAFDDQPVTS